MRRFLPSISVSRTTICFFDGEAEGWLLLIEWGWLFASIEIARRTRSVD